MTSTLDEDLHRHPLLGLHVDGLDLEALGLRVHHDGVDLDLGALPDDGPALGALLAKAGQTLRRVSTPVRAGGAKGSATVSAAVERVREWIAQKVRHLVRYALGKLAKLAAHAVGARAKGGAKRAAAGAGKPAPSRPGANPRKPPAKRRPGARTQQGPKGKPAQRPLSPVQAKQVVRHMPAEQVERLARGVTPEQVRNVAAKMPAAQAGQAAPVLKEVEEAAQQLVSQGG